MPVGNCVIYLLHSAGWGMGVPGKWTSSRTQSKPLLMSDQDLLELRSGTLTPKCSRQWVVHSDSNRHMMFLPHNSSEEERQQFSLPREDKHVLISESFVFFYFLNTNPAKQVVRSVWHWWTHLLAGKKVMEAENFLTCHLWCAFKAGNSICSIIPEELSWKLLSSNSFALLYANAFSLKLP